MPAVPTSVYVALGNQVLEEMSLSGAPHSPQRKRLSLRMKSFSLDSPESSEHVHRRQHHQLSQSTTSHSSSHNQSPQSPVYGSRRHLLTAKNVRMSSVDLPDDNEKSLSSASTSPCPSPVSNENTEKVEKEARNPNYDNFVNVTLLDANPISNFKLREMSIPVNHQFCNINRDRLITKTLARLRTGDYRRMMVDRDGRRTYRNCDNNSDTELEPAHIFGCLA
ncbi:uncharacterized protein TNCV_700311 [Trichonephila clavipes]|nr:uncharacterized protein TNCV_700311 [Trichonephila clavipes]